MAIKLENQKNNLQAKFGEDTNELMVKFNKENEMLSKKLQETQKTLNTQHIELIRIFILKTCLFEHYAV